MRARGRARWSPRGLTQWAACTLLLALGVPALGGCAGMDGRSRAPLQHIVLIKLRDESQADALLADTQRRLSAVPAVAELWVGRPFELGRPGVDLDWDVGVIVGFEDRAAYEAYLSDPEHDALVAAWQERWLWIRVHDLRGGPAPPIPEGGV